MVFNKASHWWDAFRGGDGIYEVVRQACEPDRGQRYPTVDAFHEAWLSAKPEGAALRESQ